MIAMSVLTLIVFKRAFCNMFMISKHRTVCVVLTIKLVCLVCLVCVHIFENAPLLHAVESTTNTTVEPWTTGTSTESRTTSTSTDSKTSGTSTTAESGNISTIAELRTTSIATSKTKQNSLDTKSFNFIVSGLVGVSVVVIIVGVVVSIIAIALVMLCVRKCGGNKVSPAPLVR